MRSNIFESLQLIEDYFLARKEAEKKCSKEAFAKKVKSEEELPKQVAKTAAKAEEDRVKKELRNQVVKKEHAF